MAARAIWKAVLRFGDVALPVKLYSAVEDRSIHFRLLSPTSGNPVRQRLVDPESGDEVPRDEVQKGYEIEPGRYVVLDEEELEELEPEPSRDVEIERFVARERIDHRWYERPYYLGPDASAGSRESVEASYFALAAALAERGEEGVAHWVMRGKRYLGSLHERDGYLLLVTLRPAGEVIAADALEAPSGPPLEKRELEMAEKLIAAYEGEFRPADYEDEHRRRIEELIAAKTQGAPYRAPVVDHPKKAPASLTAALEASLAAAAGGSGGGSARRGASGA